jgi:hypothetical protein
MSQLAMLLPFFLEPPVSPKYHQIGNWGMETLKQMVIRNRRTDDSHAKSAVRNSLGCK